MTVARELVPAVGGTREVPAPDPIARDYLLLVLRLDQHRPGLVDAYFGPADLKAQVDMEQLRAPAALADDAARLRGRLAAEVEDAERREWLRAQLVAIQAQAEDSAGTGLPYEDLVAAYFDRRMPRHDDAIFEAAARDIDELLPGREPLEERLAAWDDQFIIDPASVPLAADHLMARFRAQAAGLFGLPEGEAARIDMVRERPWSGYNWYEGGRRSRVEINLDLPVRASDLMHTVAHETYPGHHLEASTKEAERIDGEGRTELTLLSINTPECLLHEGLAELGIRYAIPQDEESGLLAELLEVAHAPIAEDRSRLAEASAAQVRLARARRQLRRVSGNAAFLRHVDGRSHDEVVDYVVATARQTRDRAEAILRFIEDPLWKAYVFCYREGEPLLASWLEAAPEADRVARFRRLLAEARSPSAIAAEVSSRLSSTP